MEEVAGLNVRHVTRPPISSGPRVPRGQKDKKEQFTFILYVSDENRDERLFIVREKEPLTRRISSASASSLLLLFMSGPSEARRLPPGFGSFIYPFRLRSVLVRSLRSSPYDCFPSETLDRPIGCEAATVYICLPSI